MKNIISKRVSITAAAFALLATSLSANGPQQDLRKYCIGTWRQQVRTPFGVNLVQTELRADGMFKITTVVNGDYRNPAWQSGTWELRRGNEIWYHNLAWFPLYTQDEHHTPVRMKEWISGWFEIMDADHVRNSAGIATRVK